MRDKAQRWSNRLVCLKPVSILHTNEKINRRMFPTICNVKPLNIKTSCMLRGKHIALLHFLGS